MGAFIRMRALIGIGALIDESTFEGGAYSEGALIVRTYTFVRICLFVFFAILSFNRAQNTVQYR